MTGLDLALGALFTAFGKPLDEVSLAIYERSLADVPAPLLEAAVALAVNTRTFLPRVAELRQDAETCRQRLIAQWPFVPCLACRSRRPGWITINDPAGVQREARCPCWRDYQTQLTGLGVTPQPVWLALPAGVEPEGAHDGA